MGTVRHKKIKPKLAFFLTANCPTAKCPMAKNPRTKMTFCRESNRNSGRLGVNIRAYIDSFSMRSSLGPDTQSYYQTMAPFGVWSQIHHSAVVVLGIWALFDL